MPVGVEISESDIVMLFFSPAVGEFPIVLFRNAYAPAKIAERPSRHGNEWVDTTQDESYTAIYKLIAFINFQGIQKLPKIDWNTASLFNVNYACEIIH